MLPKAARIVRALVFILLIVATIVFLLHVFFKHVPIAQTPVDVSLTAVKLDDMGNEIKTVPITIKGYINKHLFQEEQVMDVSISAFDGYTNFKMNNINDISGGVVDLSHGYYYTSYYASGSAGFEYFSIYFNEDFSRWAFVVNKYTEENPFFISSRYVATTNSSDTVSDLEKYFGGFLRIEHPIVKTDPALDWQMHGDFVHADGSSQTVAFTLGGNILDYTSKTFHKLDIQIHFPDSFLYQILTPKGGFTNWKSQNQKTPNLFVCSADSVNTEQSQTVFSYFAIDIEKEYFIAIFSDAPECYLVASMDQSAYEEILAHFEDFTQTYKSYIWND